MRTKRVLTLVISAVMFIVLSLAASAQSGQLVINMYDNYSDGWNGASIEIYEDGNSIGTTTFEDGATAVWSVEYNILCTYTFKWHKGNYDNECSYEIVADGETVYSVKQFGCNSYTEGQTVFTLEKGCVHSLGEDGLTCTICGKVCGTDFKHKFDESHKCTLCGYACGTETNPHSWENGICTVCGTACEHTYENFTCTICGIICGTDMPHSFDENHTCTVCGYACGTGANPHSWADGVCTVCEYACTHSYENDVCTICGTKKKITINMHDSGGDGWNDAELQIYGDGTLIETAIFSYGYEAYEATWSAAYDSLCTYTFKWIKGNYDNECSFEILVGDESVFSATEDDCDSFSYGQIVYTLESKCVHSFAEDSLTCMVCNRTCGVEFEHNFDENRKCAVCGFECGTQENPHDWSNADGVCAACGFVCAAHSYENYTCTICGMKMKLTINMHSSSNNSWDGAGILIYKDGEHIDIASGANTSYSIDYDSHATYEFRWSGSSFDSQCSFEILLDGEAVYTASNNDCANYYIMGGYIFTLASTCEHSTDETGLCEICGRTCGTEFAHSFDGSSVCTVCGFECGTADNGHSWSNGACSICGYSCEHSFDNGVCTSCGVENKIAVKMYCIEVPWNSIGIEVYKEGVLVGTAALDGSSTDDIWSIDYDSLATYTFIYRDTTYSGHYFFEISAVGKTLLTVKIPECENLTDGQLVYTLASTCEHSTDETGLCENCGRTCGNEFAHSFDENHTCTVCGYACGTEANPHSWANGVCTVCGAACEHTYENFTCTICGIVCGKDMPHSFDEKHTCTVCGYACGTETNPHSWSDSVCTVCEYICGHDWEDNNCTICGAAMKIVINMADDYGDGWNNAGIYVYKNGELLDFATVPDDSSTAAFSIDYDVSSEYIFKWMSGEYDDECSFEIIVNGYSMVSVNGCDNLENEEVVYKLCASSEHTFSNGAQTCSACGIICGTQFPHEFDGGSCSICGLKTEIIGYDTVGKKVTINAAEAGEYTVVFVDYKDGSLNDVEFNTVVLKQGSNELETTLTLEANDKIMLWSNITDITPLCEAYEIK